MHSDFFRVFMMTGAMKYPLLLCSIWAVYLVVQSVLFLIVNRVRSSQIDLAKAQFLSSGKSGCLHVLREDNSLPGKVMTHVLQTTRLAKADFIEDLELFIQKETSGIDRNLHFIAGIVTAAPLLGLLGTVLGIITVFNVVSGSAIGADIMALSGGVAECLLTTAGGLVIAIPAIFFHHYLVNRVDTYVGALTHLGQELSLFFQSNAGGDA